MRETDEQRLVPDTRLLETWHRAIYEPVAPEPQRVGRIRQIDPKSPALNVLVAVGPFPGVPPGAVPQAMSRFSAALSPRIQSLDHDWESFSGAARLRGVAHLVAWAHGEFVRIHPFCDGNGRMARLLANCLLLRYGIPYALSIRPRPTGVYSACAAASMTGDHTPLEQFLTREIVWSATASAESA